MMASKCPHAEYGVSPLSDWMSSLPATYLDLPLTKLAIPGSHNSGTFQLDKKDDFSPDAPATVRNLTQIPGVGAFSKDVICRWALCQTLDFMQQLHAGIRYFDLRVSTKPASDDLYFVHSLYGPKVTDLLQSVSSFLRQHPNEVVLLDFNHFYAMEEEHHVQLITLLLSTFESRICFGCDISQITLRNLWNQGKQVIIFYQHEMAQSFEGVCTTNSICAPWPNTTDHASCLEYLSNSFAKSPPTDFVVCQGVLTPSTETVMTSLFNNTSLEDLNTPWLTKLCSWVQESPKTCTHPLNIVIADFVERENFIQKVLDLNLDRG